MSAPINPPIVTFDAFPIERIDLRESRFSLSLLFYYCFFKHGLFLTKPVLSVLMASQCFTFI